MTLSTTATPPRRRALADTQASDTRERLLAAATAVLSVEGPAGFKVSDVAARAGVNVALISYHFGGKDALIDAVLRQAGRQVAQARLAALATLDAQASVEEAVRAWLRPAFVAINEPGTGVLMAHLTQMLFASDVTRQRKLTMLEDVSDANAGLLDLLQARLPHLTRRTLAWRLLQSLACYSFAFGSIPMGWAEPAVLIGTPEDPEEAYEELVAFVVAGFSAAAPLRARNVAPRGTQQPPKLLPKPTRQRRPAT